MSTERISGPLGTEHGWSHVIERYPHNCHQCGRIIEAGRMVASDWKRRHLTCHMRVRHESMSPAEQVEMLRRIEDLVNEHPEDADNDPDQMLKDGETET
jgi:hypothetical protein